MGCKGSPKHARKLFYLTGNNEQWRKSDTADKTFTAQDLPSRQVPPDFATIRDRKPCRLRLTIHLFVYMIKS
jgi:hypothetical protein